MVAGKEWLEIYLTFIAAVEMGFNVYADKPLFINSEGYRELIRWHCDGEENNVLMLYDIMDVRDLNFFPCSSVNYPWMLRFFGELNGSLENPCHHQRIDPAPFFQVLFLANLDPTGLVFDVSVRKDMEFVDVTTLWWIWFSGSFPSQILDTTGWISWQLKLWRYSLDLEAVSASNCKTAFPDFLSESDFRW